MRYENVCLEAFAYTLPQEIVTSEDIERRLAPLYTRLGLSVGRLELISGIRQRRFWPPGTLPSQISVETAEKAIRIAGVEKRHFGALIHGSVCRDYLEPATACGVHQQLALPRQCMIYDISNACLGLLSGLVQIANMIELGQIRAGVVVGTESGRALVENTIAELNANRSLSRAEIKKAFASLTIGSGSAAIVLVDRKLSRTGNRLLGGIFHANTEQCHLCRSGREESADAGMRPLMWTDAEALLHQGIATAKVAFREFLACLGWSVADVHKAFSHQVGRIHQKMTCEALRIDPAIDYPTVEFLGNTGSAALPIGAALGIETGHVRPGDHVALLGIGSGINVVALGVDWQRSLVGKGSTVPGDLTKSLPDRSEKVTRSADSDIAVS